MTVAHLAIVDWVKQDWQTGSFCIFSTVVHWMLTGSLEGKVLVLGCST